MNSITIAAAIFLVLVIFLFVVISQMASAGEKAETLANEGRDKLQEAQKNSLSSQVEIRRLNKIIFEMKKKSNVTASSLEGSGVKITNFKDAAEILGLEEGFSQEELKRKHRHLSKKVHPDVQGTTGLFIVVDSAYQLLKK